MGMYFKKNLKMDTFSFKLTPKMDKSLRHESHALSNSNVSTRHSPEHYNIENL